MIEIKHQDTGVVLHRVDAGTLVGADLSKINLSHANLKEADLTAANLNGTDLRAAHLPGAFLDKADLREARLDWANLRAAFLSGANLSGAVLTSANLSWSDLKGADLRGAVFAGTNLDDCTNLHEALHLDEVKHLGPSSLNVSTLRSSVLHLPDAFLRGAGLSDTEIRGFRDLYKAGSALYFSCFISYSHADKAFAQRLFDALQAHGIRCWLDEHQVLPGDDIFEQVDRGVRLWDKVLLCASENSLISWWVDNEINTAFAKEQKLMKASGGKRILSLIPLNLDGFMFSGKWHNGKAEQVKSRLAADFTEWETDPARFDQQLERLLRAMRADEAGRETPPPPRL